jgi:hypothetical protein
MARIVAENQGDAVVLSLQKRDRAGIIFHVPEMLVSYSQKVKHERLANDPMSDDSIPLPGLLPAGRIRQLLSFGILFAPSAYRLFRSR